LAGAVDLGVGAGAVPPPLDVDLPDPEELVLEELEPLAEPLELLLEEAAVAFFPPGSGVNGLRALPECWEAPLVVSATALLDLAGAWLMAIAPVAPEEALVAGAGAGALDEPDPSTA
jgi:hypothetical protein